MMMMATTTRTTRSLIRRSCNNSNNCSSLRFFSYYGAALRRKAIEKHGAPPEITAIAEDDAGIDAIDTVANNKTIKSGAMIRQVGCTRHLFLLNSNLTPDEIKGLAYRVRALTKNDSINSVLVSAGANNQATEDSIMNDIDIDPFLATSLPSSLLMRDDPYLHNESAADDDLELLPAVPGGYTYHVSNGYDPIDLAAAAAAAAADNKSSQQDTAVNEVLESISDLTLAVRGHSYKTKVPVISFPHGMISDAGYAFLNASYVLATHETGFHVTYPTKGLSLDPVGLSFALPRLGQEFNQPCAQHCPNTVGMILGLLGYQANAYDMVETGLATHYIGTSSVLGQLEQTLAELPPWNQQGLLKNPIKFHGQQQQSMSASMYGGGQFAAIPPQDHNAQYRNVVVADTVHCFSEYRADGADMWLNREGPDAYIGEDPSLDVDLMPWHEARSSDLVDISAAFHTIFNEETSLVVIRERLQEIAGSAAADEDEQEAIDIATEFVTRIENQSPLAMSVIYKLLTLGSDQNETLQSCMDREHLVQSRMYQMSDFQNWAKYEMKKRKKKSWTTKKGDDDDNSSSLSPSSFTGWKHARLEDVTNDEVEELFQQQKQQ